MTKGIDADFEAFRRERNHRRRQTHTTERPGGHTDVWEQLEERDSNELQEQLLSADVEDFFTDATKLAASIVSKVSDNREEQITGKLRDEMEDFLFESIRRATNMVMSIDWKRAQGITEENLISSTKNLNSQEMDEFRAEGTARLADRHFGQDPFNTDLSAAGGGAIAAPTEPEPEPTPETLADRQIEISEDELALDYDSSGQTDLGLDETQMGESVLASDPVPEENDSEGLFAIESDDVLTAAESVESVERVESAAGVERAEGVEADEGEDDLPLAAAPESEIVSALQDSHASFNMSNNILEIFSNKWTLF